MKRGFTLVELLAVLVILGVVVVIAAPVVVETIDKATNQGYEETLNEIYEAARLYCTDEHIFVEEGKVEYISISTLVQKDYLSTTPKDKNEAPMNGFVQVTGTNQGQSYLYLQSMPKGE